jgi:glycosyltransferase involved in cell wall biosynthesis
MIRAGINSLQVRGAKSGVGRYISCLLEEMLPMATDMEFVNYVNSFNEQNYDFPNNNYRPQPWGSNHASKWVRLLYEYAFLPRQLRKDNLSFFHAPSNLLPMRKACPYIVTIHDMSYFVDTTRYTKSKVFYWQTVTKRTVKLADYIITDSEYSKGDILKFFSFDADKIIPIHIAPHASFKPVDSDLVTDSFLKKYNLKRKRYILNVGTLEPGKNQSRIVQAFHRFLKKTGEDFDLVIVGDKGWLYDDVYRRIERLGLKDRVHITGHIPDEDLVLFYNCALFFIFPSLNEGFGLPVLEAMACGLPVIASHSSALPETAGKAAIFVDPYDVQAIAHTMEDLAGDREQREKYRKKGLERAKKFNWKKTAESTLSVYRMVI